MIKVCLNIRRFDVNGQGAHGGGHGDHGESGVFDFTEILILQVTLTYFLYKFLFPAVTELLRSKEMLTKGQLYKRFMSGFS